MFHARQNTASKGAANRQVHQRSLGQLRTLEDRSYKTYRARLYASKRLQSRNHRLNASLIAMSTATTIAAVILLANPSLYGQNGPLLLAGLAILALMLSLVSTSIDYSGRSRNMFISYRRIQRVASEAERLQQSSTELLTAELVQRLTDEYEALLDESENHTEADYYRSCGEPLKLRHYASSAVVVLLPVFSFVVGAVALVVPIVKALT